MSNLESALNAWQGIVGTENVVIDEASLSAVQKATFHTTQLVPAIIRPGNSEEVKECVKVANKYKTPIYPVSRGKNWGYGSRVPVRDGCVVIELRRLNQILDYNEKLAYVTLQPGVTFAQLYDYLCEKSSGLIFSGTGGPPDSSIIGNTLERGIGKGLYGDRFERVCGFEVILPTGELIHTGFERFANVKINNVCRWGIGPYVDGLFTQSNLGIVTKMTYWLTPRPKYFQTFFYHINDSSRLGELIDTLRILKLQGILKATFGIYNNYRVLSIRSPYPWKKADGKTPLSLNLANQINRKLSKGGVWAGAWNGEGALYSVSKKHGRVERELIEQALGKIVDKIVFVDEKIAKFVRAAQTCYNWITGKESDAFFDLAYSKSPFLGVPLKMSAAATYWRKHSPIPSDMNPDKDGCGIIWCSPSVPFESQHIKIAVTIIEKTMCSYKFEPFITLQCVTERNIDVISSITYDREVKGEDSRAMACYHEMLQKLSEKGYFPYRLSIQTMDALPPAKDGYGKFLKTLKYALDPNDILAPGRYDFRSDWPEKVG